MDSVRFGRVLGIGVRLAAKTVASAVDAAAAPSPATPAGATGSANTAASSTKPADRPAARMAAPLPFTKKAAPAPATAKQQANNKQANMGLKEGGKRLGEAIWGPFARLGGVLWLEVTGVFFGLMAFSVGAGAWKMRGALHGTATNHVEHVRLLVAIGITLVFGYFCVSSYVRAGRRGKRR